MGNEPSTEQLRPLRICIDARITSGVPGGVEQAVIGLADGLSRLADGDEEYLFLADPDDSDWIRPYLRGRCRLLEWRRPPGAQAWMRSAKKLARLLLGTLGDHYYRLASLPGLRPLAPNGSDGTVERAGVSVMHFTLQQAFLTHIPSIYHPHDLQHLHLPKFFSPRDRLARDLSYRTFCARAEMVVMMSSWGRRDVIQQFGLPDSKVKAIPWASLLPAAAPSLDELAAVRRQYGLRESFAFYPAQTWAHKNHLALLEALAILRDRNGLVVPLVCSGRMNSFYPNIERRVRDLKLSGQVRFLGFVTPTHLRWLYAAATFLIFPTLFEGFGLPVVEAFDAGLPVACSDVTSLPEQAGDAALLFDPRDPEQIADAILRLWTDEALRTELVQRGRARVSLYSWERTARIFRAHYRRIAGRELTEEDHELIGASGSYSSPELTPMSLEH